MRVLHYEHMGVGVVLAEAQRQMGVEAIVVSKATHPFGFKEDRLLKEQRKMWHQLPVIGEKLHHLEYLRQLSGDVMHCHDNVKLPDFVFKGWRKRIVQHYHDPNTSAPLYDGVPSLASVPSIIKAVPNAVWCPFPVDTEMFKPSNKSVRSKVVIGYCGQQVDPTKRQYIPALEIEGAVAEMSEKACTNPLRDIIPHQSMPSYYKQIDVWVDRVGLGFYGFATVEAAAMGIPVITQISEEAMTYVPDCPFVNVKNRSEVKEAVKMLVQNEKLRKTLGDKARDFAVRVHDSFQVAQLCLNKYQELRNVSL